MLSVLKGLIAFSLVMAGGTFLFSLGGLICTQIEENHTWTSRFLWLMSISFGVIVFALACMAFAAAASGGGSCGG